MTTEDGARSSGALDPSPTHSRETLPGEFPREGQPRGAHARDAAEQPTAQPTEQPIEQRSQPATGRSAGAVQRPTRAPGSRPPARRPKKKSFLRELPGIVLTALVISVLIKTFLVQAFYIPSGSMENTLLVNDRVLVNKLADKPDEVHRGDVVVFRDPGGWLGSAEESNSGDGLVGAIRRGLVFVGLAPAAGEEDLIKRVIGVGGDKVECCDAQGRVTVNGAGLSEPYLYPSDRKHPSQPFGPFTVPTGELWVMGDHRSVSQDSREHVDQPGKGFVPVDDVVGRAFTIVWPLDRARILHRPDTFLQPRLERAAP